MTKRRRHRLPIEQLRESGKIAHEMLVAKGVIAKDSLIDKMLADKNAPKLPGIPAYLPHEWTLKASQRIVRDLLVMWMERCDNDEKKAENITEFWKFVVDELTSMDERYEKEEKEMAKLVKKASLEGSLKDIPVLKEIFSPIRKRENMKAMTQFLIDSFAVAVIVEKRDTTSEYLNWFLDWTQDMHAYWVRPNKRKAIKRT